MRRFITIFTLGPPSDHTAHATVICCNLPIHNFTGERKNLTDGQETST